MVAHAGQQSGCIGVFFGIETSGEESLRDANKRQNKVQSSYQAAVDALHRRGCAVSQRADARQWNKKRAGVGRPASIGTYIFIPPPIMVSPPMVGLDAPLAAGSLMKP